MEARLLARQAKHPPIEPQRTRKPQRLRFIHLLGGESTTRMQPISQKVISSIDPSLTRLRQAVEQCSVFRLSTCGVVRDGSHVFTVGISCEPVSYPLTDVAFSFACVGFTVPDAPDTQFTVSVGWHRSGIAGKHDGFSIYEANGGPFRFTDESDIQNLVAEFPRMEAAMIRGLRRGRPPSRLAIAWGRLLRRCHASQTHRVAA